MSTPTTPPRMIGYCRVSTEEQRSSGLSLDAQRAAIEEACRQRGFDLVAVHGDPLSGRSMKRPELQHVLAEIAGGRADGIIVTRVDRLSRSMIDFASLMERARSQGWSIVALDLGVDMTTPAGEMVANVVASVAQYERRLISERTREALLQKAKRGRRLGRPLVVAQDVVDRIWAMRANGMPLRKIADALNAEGVRSGLGKPWHFSTVNVMMHPRYVSKHEHLYDSPSPTVARSRHGHQPVYLRPIDRVRMLSTANLELLADLSARRSVTTIAERHGITERTVRRRIATVRKLLDTTDIAEAIDFFRRARSADHDRRRLLEAAEREGRVLRRQNRYVAVPPTPHALGAAPGDGRARPTR